MAFKLQRTAKEYAAKRRIHKRPDQQKYTLSRRIHCVYFYVNADMAQRERARARDKKKTKQKRKKQRNENENFKAVVRK